MLLGCRRPLLFTVGIMNTSTSRDITHWAIDSSRYCRVLLRKPFAPLSGWKMRAEMPIFRVRRVMLFNTLSDSALKRAEITRRVWSQAESSPSRRRRRNCDGSGATEEAALDGAASGLEAFGKG